MVHHLAPDQVINAVDHAAEWADAAAPPDDRSALKPAEETTAPTQKAA